MKRDERHTGSGFSRREVLGGSSALAAATLLGREARATPRPGGGRDVLVNIFLRGGIDALNTVVPYTSSEYYAARPTLAVPPPGQPNGATALDGFFALSPKATPLLTPYLNGHLAFVHAAGSPDPTRSHFDGFARMEFGEPNMPPGTLTNGWLARYLDETAGLATGALRAIAAADYLPRSLTGAPGTLPIPDFASFAFPGNPATAQRRSAELLSMYGDAPPMLGPTAVNTFDSVDLMSPVDFAGYVPANGAQYPPYALGTRLKHTAALIKAGLGVEVVHIDYSDWDHHANQAGVFANMLDDLAKALAAFYLDMQAGIDQVCVVCMSEFGRRLQENSSLGTDHGHGGLMIVMGGGIDGGQVITSWPGLAPAQLDDGDLAVTIDYRDVLGEIMDRRLGVTDVSQVFPFHTFTTHGVTV